MNKKTIFLSVLGILIIIIGFFFLDKVFTANAVLDESIVYTTEQMAVYRPSTGDWHIRREDGSTTNYSYGDPGDIPIPADYDGDGLTDIAIYRPSTLGWSLKLDNVDLDHLNAYKLISGPAKYYKISNSNENIPVPEDYDYDGTDDLAVFNPRMGNWVFVDGNGILQTVTFGDLESLPIPADYDGDGKVNLATYKVGIWKILLGNGTEVEYEYGNADEHIPVPADYDGDGLTDIAFYNEDNGIGWIWFSSEEPDYLKESNLHEGSGNHGKYSWGGGEEWASPLTSPLSLRGAQRGGRNIGTIGPEEIVSERDYWQIKIDTDSSNQPHVVYQRIDNLASIDMVNKINGNWIAKSDFIVGRDFGNVLTLGGPMLNINENDVAWMSTAPFGLHGGGHLVLIEGISHNPTKKLIIKNIGMPSSDSSMDPYTGDEVYITGMPTVLRCSTKGECADDISINMGFGGERFRMEISPRKGQKGVFHTATDWTYQNSVRDKKGLPYITFKGEGDDHAYPNLGIDLENPEVAYWVLAGGNNRLMLNIFDGSKMIYGFNHKMLAISAPYGNNRDRFFPGIAPAQGGGAFVCWTSPDLHIKLKYITYTGVGEWGPEVDMGPGQKCSIATDSEGQIHIAYNNGGVKYRKIQTS